MEHAAPASIAPAGPAATRNLVGVAIVLAGLHVGRDVLIPMALALLLSAARVPVARTLERIGIPRVLAPSAWSRWPPSPRSPSSRCSPPRRPRRA
jgi:predicted PurR-regulated permease PerM